MHCTSKRLALAITIMLSALSIQLAAARGDMGPPPSEPDPASPFYFIDYATTGNGRGVAQVLDRAVDALLESGNLSVREQYLIADDARYMGNLAPGRIGAVLEQLAGSQNANLGNATQSSLKPLQSSLLSAMGEMNGDANSRVWLQGLGNAGSLDPQHGSAGLKHDTQGLLLGADWAIDHAWRVGVMGAKTSSRFDAPRYAAELDSWHLGGYAVRQDGPFALRLGAIYSNHAGQNKRSVSLLNYHDSLKSKYNASSQTLFSELGYQLGSGDSTVEPFVGLGYQRYQRDRFKESGGVTALNVGPQTQRNLNSTFGLRLATLYRFDNNMSLTPHLSTSWKHLYGDVNSQVRQTSRYAPGLIDGYTITGTALDRDSFDLQAGLDLALSTQHSVGLTYTSQAGNHGHDQGLMGQWKMSF